MQLILNPYHFSYVNCSKLFFMKKICLLIAIITFSLSSFSQTCEERENKMLTTIGGLSATMLYNTYGVIGAVGDGFIKDVYSSETLSDLILAQIAVADNLIKMLEDNLNEKVFVKKDDQDFINATIGILKGLKIQAQYLIDFSKTNSGNKKEAYTKQRQTNWSAISKLMGIDD